MTDCPFEAGKEYRTRDGRRARVYCVDGRPPRVVHGAILTDSGWYQVNWPATGMMLRDIQREFEQDLMPPEPPHEWKDGDVAMAKPVSGGGGVLVWFDRATEVVTFNRADLEHMLAMMEESSDA